MAFIIAVENTKGGTGKSTTVSNLSRGLQLSGANVLIIDRDPQRSIRDWREVSEKDDYPLVVGIDTPTIHSEIKRITDQFDYIIIDGAAKVEDMAASSIRAADLILIPIQPSGAEVRGCKSLINLIHARQEVTDGKPIARFLINREKKRTVLAREIQSALDNVGMESLTARISDSVLYTECLGNGSSVFDEKGTQAEQLQAEIKQLIAEIRELAHDKEIRCV